VHEGAKGEWLNAGRKHAQARLALAHRRNERDQESPVRETQFFWAFLLERWPNAQYREPIIIGPTESGSLDFEERLMA